MEIITLGIGTPSDIPHFVLVGLSPTGPVDVSVLDLGVTEAVSLMPSRSMRSVMPVRDVTSLMPTRTVQAME